MEKCVDSPAITGTPHDFLRVLCVQVEHDVEFESKAMTSALFCLNFSSIALGMFFAISLPSVTSSVPPLERRTASRSSTLIFPPPQ